jgi:hypothetical protein
MEPPSGSQPNARLKEITPATHDPFLPTRLKRARQALGLPAGSLHRWESQQHLPMGEWPSPAKASTHPGDLILPTPSANQMIYD